jgi:hypothetical protein
MSDTLEVFREHAASLSPTARLAFILQQIQIAERVIEEEKNACPVGERIDPHFVVGVYRSSLDTIQVIAEAGE